MTFKAIKFRVFNEDHSRRVQEAMIACGYKWMDTVIQHLDKPFLYGEDCGAICFGTAPETFEEAENATAYVMTTGIYTESGEVVPKVGEFISASALEPYSVSNSPVPVGLRPQNIALQARNTEILEAMLRYSKAFEVIPETWTAELEANLTRLRILAKKTA